MISSTSRHKLQSSSTSISPKCQISRQIIHSCAVCFCRKSTTRCFRRRACRGTGTTDFQTLNFQTLNP
jgi:hypothetical protein